MAQLKSNSDPDAVRRKYLYRKLVMNQGVKLPSRLAMKLVGPDCAYHLYRQHSPNSERDITEPSEHSEG